MATSKGPTLQSFRSVYIPDSSGNAAPPSVNININARFDSQLHQHIVLWNDILRVFRNALYIQADGALVSFLTNDNFEDLMPLRIAHHPGIQLDVVLEIPPSNIPLSHSSGPSPYSAPPTSSIQVGAGGEFDITSPALSNNRSVFHSPSISAISSSSHSYSSSADETWTGNRSLLVAEMGSVRIARAPEERTPVPPTFSVDTATTGAAPVYYPPPAPKPPHQSLPKNSPIPAPPAAATGTAAVYYPPSAPKLQHQSLPKTPPIPTPPAVRPISAVAPVNTLPVPIVTVVQVHSDNDNSNGNNLTASGYLRFFGNATQGHSRESSTEEQEKLGHAWNTVQTVIAGAPSSPNQPTNSPHTHARYDSSNYAQALISPTAGTMTTVAATITGSRPISMQLAVPSTTARPPGAPKQLNIQPRPQAWFDPSDINQAPQETQDRIQSYKTYIQSREWHESPLPRLFIVLPKSCLHDNKLTLGWDKFRFFWMCEFFEPAPHPVSYPSQSPVMGGGVGGLAPHVGHHGGYDLVHPEEFFRKYRAALLLNLQMFKFSARNTSTTFVNGGGRNKGGVSIYDQGVAFLQMSMKLCREEIELYLDLMISHLEQLSSEVTNEIQDSQKAGGRGAGVGAEGGEVTDQEQLPILTDKELKLIQSYLIATSSTDSGIDQLHNQYRYVDSQGHVQWICLSHMKLLRPNYDPEAVGKAIESAGMYSAQDASLNMTDMSMPNALSVFSDTNLIPTYGVADVTLNMSKADWWASSINETKSCFFRDDFWFGLMRYRLTNLSLTGSRDYEFPYFQSPVPLVDFLLVSQQLQSLRVESAQGLLKTIKPPLQIRPSPRLRVLDLTIDTDKDVEDIKRALAMLVGSATGLRKLRIAWNDLNQGGNSTRVVAFLRTFSFKLREPVEVVVKTGEEEISMTIQDGNFQDVHLKVATMAVAEKHPMMWLKALGTLTVKNRENLDSAETRTKLMRILGLNPLLTTLRLECWAYDFQTAEETVKSVVQGVPCGLTKVVLKDSLVDAEEGIADELTLTFNLAKLTSLTPTKASPPLRLWSNDDKSLIVHAEVRASSHESEFECPAILTIGVDNSLFYLNYGPAIRNMHLGKWRFRELRKYLESIQVGYKRIYLTCLAIQGFWPELPKVLERTNSSLKLLAVQRQIGPITASNNVAADPQSTLIVRMRIAELFRGDRLVLIHQDDVSDDEEVKTLMAPSRCVVTFARDQEAWDRIVSDLFAANKP